MKELKKAQMGMIAILTVMLVSIKRRLPATRRLSSGITTTLALAGIVLLVAAGGASANGVCVGEHYNFSCGDVVNESCTLNASMICTDNSKAGLYIGADDIVIDGAGFSMTGSKSAAACGAAILGAQGQTTPEKHSGIYNGYDGGVIPVSHDNVVVKDLEIEYFCTGIAIGDGSFATDIDNMTVTGCYIHDCGESTKLDHGIHMVYTNNCNITKNEISYIEGTGDGCSGGGNGIFLYGVDEGGATRGHWNNFTCNYLHHTNKSGWFSKHMCKYNTISYNNATHNNQSGIMPKCEKTNYNEFEYNNMSYNGLNGFYLGGDNNIIRYNTMINNGAEGLGLKGTADSNTITNNTACGNGGTGDMAWTDVTNIGDSNTCDSGPTGACDWSCGSLAQVYFDFDNDGYYSDDSADCSCGNTVGVGSCGNPGLFDGSADAKASYEASCDCQWTPGTDPNDCDPSVLGEQKPDYIVTAVGIVWLDDAQYNVTYTVKNDGDAAATVESNTSITVDASIIEVMTPGLVIDKYETWIDESAGTYNITYLICNNGTRDGTQSTTTKVATEDGSTGKPDKGVPPIPQNTCIWRVANDTGGAEQVYTMGGSFDHITLTANKGGSVMTELDHTNNEWDNWFYGAVVVAIDPCPVTIGSDPSDRTTVDITLSNIVDYGSGTIHLYYDKNMVEVDSVDLGDSTDVTTNPTTFPGHGHVEISASNTDGVSNDVAFANVTFRPIASSGCTYINLTVETLYDRSYTVLQTVVTNCTEFCIEEENIPQIPSYPVATPDRILNDTPLRRARVQQNNCTNITNLSVRVTDDTEVAAVYVNLTPILGAGHEMVQMQGAPSADGYWYLDTNANYSSPILTPWSPTPYSLNVMAKDIYNNWNNGSNFELTVLRRGDVSGVAPTKAPDNVVDDLDYFFIAKYTVGLESEYEMYRNDRRCRGEIVSDASWNGIDMADALYIAMYHVDKGPLP
jgi:hypothetical protein